ncbi:MAG: hypothetical protein KDB03_13865 [Planctomycetales bacterium]|nr:hypothetical protein [Planctomycetales bacterium]
MIRKWTLSIAIAAACAVPGASTANAQESDVAASSSGTTVKAELAAYKRDYACNDCGTGGYSSAFSASGMGAYPAASAPQAMAFGQAWGSANGSRDCNRFLHYPYVYYPQNFRGSEYYRSSDSMYYRYPPEMQIPVYNKKWQNYYPSDRRYHWGHHFILDVF